MPETSQLLVSVFSSLPITRAYAWLAGWAADRAGAMRRLDRIAGLMSIGFGIRLALSQRPSA